jgi:hypothetical protein
VANPAPRGFSARDQRPRRSIDRQVRVRYGFLEVVKIG